MANQGVPTKILALAGVGSLAFPWDIIPEICDIAAFAGSEIRLYEDDAKAREECLAYAQGFGGPAHINFTAVRSLEEALAGADYVVNASLPGGAAWIKIQRSLAASQGFGQDSHLEESYQMAYMLYFSRLMKRYAPNAWLIQVTRPVSEACKIAQREGLERVLGVGPSPAYLSQILEILRLDPASMVINTVGLNNFTWVTDFLFDGRNAAPLLNVWLDREGLAYAQRKKAGYDPFAAEKFAHFKTYGALPLGYAPGNGSNDGNSRIYKLADPQDACGAVRVKPRLMADNLRLCTMARNIAEIIQCLAFDSKGVFLATTRNDGQALPAFPKKGFIECTALVGGGAVFPGKVHDLPPEVAIKFFLPYWGVGEALADAVQAASEDLLLMNMTADQLDGQAKGAKELFDRWMAHPGNVYMKKLLTEGF